MSRAPLAVTLLLLAAVACAKPIGVRRVSAQEAQRSLGANVLDTGRPSARSRQILDRAFLADRWQKRPAEALALLRQQWLSEQDPVYLFPLAELSFAYAEQDGGRPYFLAAAVYAYAFLFPGPGAELPGRFEPQLREAANLYNRGLTRALMNADGTRLEPEPGTYPLPFGHLTLEESPTDRVRLGYPLDEFVPLADLEVRGFRNRYRMAGVGAPVAVHIVKPEDPDDRDLPYERWMPDQLRVAGSIFVRVPDVIAQLRRGLMQGRIEIHLGRESATVEVDGRQVPLELEPTASLAYMLDRSDIWRVEIAGFRGDELGQNLAEARLVMLTPHERGRIPVVFVHGTASSPARWAEMVNELAADPLLLGRYEFWFFFYKSGNPILYSAALLRESLSQAFAELDPDGTDPGLQRTVMIGHSQGGLLTKLMVVEGGDRFWANVSEAPLDELDLQPETKDLLREAIYFEPLPQVRRVIFMATPHGGSFLAGKGIGNFAASLVKLPGNLGRLGADLLDDSEANRVQRSIDSIPNSVDNMKPDSPFLKTLRTTPIDERVVANSIIAVRGEGVVFNQHDGVVAYEAAHLEGAESEKIVISGHSVQGNPDAVQEVRRILHLHLTEPK